MAAFLASPGPAQNLEAAQQILEAMIRAAGARRRTRAGRGRPPDRASAGRSRRCSPPLIARPGRRGGAARDRRGARAGPRGHRRCAARRARPRRSSATLPAAALARFGNSVVPEIAGRLDERAGAARGRAASCRPCWCGSGRSKRSRCLIGSLLHADPTLRHRVIASLNKLRTMHPEVWTRSGGGRTAAGGGDRRALPFVSGPRAAAAASAVRAIPCSRRWATRWSRSSSASSA